jgi:hypothetical protein
VVVWDILDPYYYSKYGEDFKVICQTFEDKTAYSTVYQELSGVQII